MLEMLGVSKRYDRGREQVCAVDDLHLQVAAGEFVGLIGPSGSGKSTVLHLAAGLDLPDSGRVLVDGQDLSALSVAARARLRRRSLGFVFQFFHLIPNLSVRENVALPLLLDGQRHVDRRAAELVDRVGLAARAGHFPAELSGGEMQRVAIARALVTGPRLILADEPTGNLDSATGEQILDLLQRQVAEAGAALLMVTHNLDAVVDADRVVTLHDGRLTETRSAQAAGRT